VITSTAFVIGLAPVIVLGLADRAQLSKVAVSGRVLYARRGTFITKMHSDYACGWGCFGCQRFRSNNWRREFAEIAPGRSVGESRKPDGFNIRLHS
jgi:hypothetical protein